MLTVAVILVLAYLVGSIPGSVWTGKLLYGEDVRDYGSGNAGATNVFRVLGWKAGVVATVVDLGKGLFAAGVLGTQVRLGDLPAWGLVGWEAETVICLAAGLAAIVGHMYPVWARFRGGKGVNTAAGVLFALTPVTTLVAVGVFVLVLALSRYVSLASMTAAVAFPSTVAVRRYLLGAESLDPSLLVFGALLAAGILVAHRSNIKRLLNGNENRVRSFSPAKGRLHKREV
jgi:glycerol-3-phosphate acyltransferase PlsY